MSRDVAIVPSQGGSVTLVETKRPGGKPGFMLMVRSYSGDSAMVVLTEQELKKLLEATGA